MFADRYHAHVLKSPREVRHALTFVLNNAAHDGIHLRGTDLCSSGAWFDGWRGMVGHARDWISSPLPVARGSSVADGGDTA